MSVTIHQGDALTVLATLPSESVHCCVTSPPYWGLRDYGTATWEGGDVECDHLAPKAGGTGAASFIQVQVKRVEFESGGQYRDICKKCGAKRIDSQLGLEPTPEEYIARMVAVFREVKRVLRSDGTCWVNMGDSYFGGGRGGNPDESEFRKQATNAGSLIAPTKVPPGCKPKDLCGIPWMLAFALRADGWYLRSDIIWAKPNPMPESVTDRPTKSHEYLFLLSKSQTYYYDAEAIREEGTRYEWNTQKFKGGDLTKHHGSTVGKEVGDDTAGRNKRTVWTVATQPTPDAHFATFPEELIKPCILAGTSEKGCCSRCGAPWERQIERGPGLPRARDEERNCPPGTGSDGRNNISGAMQAKWKAENPDKQLGWQATCTCDAHVTRCTVLDPFFDSGTTGLVARMNGSHAIGIELNPAYIKIAERRLAQDVLGVQRMRRLRKCCAWRNLVQIYLGIPPHASFRPNVSDIYRKN